MNGKFYKKWWFWLLAVLLAVSVPFAIREARAPAKPDSPPSDGAVSQPEDGAGEDSQSPAQTGPEQEQEPDEGSQPEEKPEAETKPEADPEPGAEQEPGSDPEPGAEQEPGNDPQADPEDKPEPDPEPEEPGPEPGDGAVTYVLNKNTKKFHYPTCRSVAEILEKNRQDFTGTREEAIALGYAPCGICKP